LGRARTSYFGVGFSRAWKNHLKIGLKLCLDLGFTKQKVGLKPESDPPLLGEPLWIKLSLI
jgi:hypothetical protein